jgi:uncharacterized protein (TIGR00251 family)
LGCGMETKRISLEKYPFASVTSNGLFLQVLVQPKSSRNEISGVQDNHLKIHLTAPPVEGAANKACVEFFSELLRISRSRIKIVSGQKSRRKKLFIETDNPDLLLKALPL